MSDGFDEDEARQLEITNIITSTFSLVGSLFIIICYLKFQDLRSFAFRLVFLVAISDFGFAIGNMLGDTGGNEETHLGASSSLCEFQSILISYFQLASMLWSVSIAFTLHMAFLKENRNFSSTSVNQYQTYYHAICWGYPLLMTLLPLSSSAYGDTGGWCWIESDETSKEAWRFVQFYVPLWFFVGYNTYVYVSVIRKISNMQGQGGRMLSRIKYYPLVLVICHFWGTINTMNELFTGDLVLWLNILHTMFASSQGLINALVYGFTPAVAHQVFTHLPCLTTPPPLREEETNAEFSQSQQNSETKSRTKNGQELDDLNDPDAEFASV